MHDSCAFSIVITCYNYGGYLTESIESVLAQRRADIQIVLVDDASSDNTPVVAEQFKSHVEYVRNDTTLGAGGAWLKGLSRAKGKYVMKLDADDILLPGFCNAVERRFLADETIGIVITSAWITDESRGLTRPEYISQTDLVLDADAFRSRLLKSFFFRMPGCVLKHEILSKHEPPDEALYQIHDWEYFLRVTKGYGAALVREPLAVYRIHDRSISATAQTENRLYRDIKRWMFLAQQGGEHHIPESELNVLRGSFAELMITGTGSRLTARSIRQYLMNYPKALQISISGGLTQIMRMHRSLAAKISRRLPFTSAYRDRCG